MVLNVPTIKKIGVNNKYMNTLKVTPRMRLCRNPKSSLTSFQSIQSTSSTPLNSAEYYHLALRSAITCDVHALKLVLGYRDGPEALRRGTVVDVRIPEDIRVAGRAVSGSLWSKFPSATSKGHFDNFITCGRNAVPATMEGNVHTRIILVEHSIKRCRMSCKGQRRLRALLHACSIGESLVGRQDELITHGKLFIGNILWLPYRIACRISVPLRVFFRWVAEVVDLVGGIISVNIYDLVADSAMDLI